MGNCELTNKGRHYTCRQLWPDDGPYAWCPTCIEQAEREVRKLAKQVGLKVVDAYERGAR